MSLMYTTISLEPLTCNILVSRTCLCFTPKRHYCPFITISKDKSRRKGEKNDGFIYFMFCYILYGVGDGKAMVCGGVLGKKWDIRSELLI